MKKLNIEFPNEIQLPEPDRLVTLSDGRRGLRGCLSVHVSEPNANERYASARSAAHPLSSSRGGEGRLVAPQSDGGGGEEANSPHQLAGSEVQPTGLSETSSSEPERAPVALPILDFVASDETLDRYSEIICASGWRLEHYLRNPVFQNSHQYGDVIFTLGKALETRVVDGRLRQRIQFATDANPMARIAYGLYKGGFLNAVSVGFIPIRWEDNPGGVDGKNLPRRRYLEQELLEVSAVSVPANPNALIMGIKSGAVEKSDVRELLGLLRAAVSVRAGERERVKADASTLQHSDAPNETLRSDEEAIRNADTRALGVPGDEARSWLLRAVKRLAEVMRKAKDESASQ